MMQVHYIESRLKKKKKSSLTIEHVFGNISPTPVKQQQNNHPYTLWFQRGAMPHYACLTESSDSGCPIGCWWAQAGIDLLFSTSLIRRFFGSLARVVAVGLSGKPIFIPQPAEAVSASNPPTTPPRQFPCGPVVGEPPPPPGIQETEQDDAKQSTHSLLPSAPASTGLSEMVRGRTSLYSAFPFLFLQQHGAQQGRALLALLEKNSAALVGTLLVWGGVVRPRSQS